MKNKLTYVMIAVCLILNITHIDAKTYYVSPDGKDSNSGKLEAPFATIEKAISMLQAGDICYVRGGTYYPTATINVTQTGTKDARICLFAYEDEKPVINFEKLANTPEDVAKANRGIYHKIGANYWHYKGLEFCNAPDNAMKLEGSFCVIERCTFHDNGDTGLQQGFGKGSNGENTRNQKFEYGRYNIVLNCDSYNNCDVWSNGGDADGFAVKLFPGPGNEFHGCRSWYNSDDGWDFYYTVFPIVVDNCWTMKNGYNKGNGNGFKMGGSNEKTRSYGGHVFTNCISADNLNKGFDQNNHNEGTYMINCVSVRNGINFGFNMAAPANGKWHVYNCIGFGGKERNHQFQTNKNTISTVDTKTCSWTDIDGASPYSDRDGTDPFTGASYSKKVNDHTTEFISLAYEDAIAERQADGQLPLKFGRLTANSIFKDKGTNIDNLQTEDCDKEEYKLCGTKTGYGITVSLPHNGTADMGAFEYGTDNNEYTLVMPENDGSVPEVEPGDNEWEENGKYYAEDVFVDWYKFQDAALPQTISSIIGDLSANVKPAYVGKSADGTGDAPEDQPNSNYSGSKGAFRIQKETSVTFTLPSLRSLKTTLYCTGGRTLKVNYSVDNGAIWSADKTKDYSTGTSAEQDIAALCTKTKSPILVKLTNTKGGDMYITDLYVSGYKEVENDDDDDPSAIDSAKEESFDMYQTETALIVYGEIASLQIVSMNGAVVSASQNMQVVGTANLSKGVYAVIIVGKDGKRSVRKFMKM